MPTYPVTLPDGARVRLTAPQWRCLCAIVTRLRTRPLETWLPRDLFPRATQNALLCGRLAQLGVLMRTTRGFTLPLVVRAQVPITHPQGAPHATS